MENDAVILIHRFGYDNLGKRITYGELLEYLGDNDIDHSSEGWRDIISHVIRESFHIASARYYEDSILIFKSEAYYRYLEYLELQAANNNAKESRIMSIIAIGIASLLAFIQIWVQLKQN